MNIKKFVLTVVVVCIVANLSGFLIHAHLLAPDYMAVASQYRPMGEEKFLFINLGYLAFAIGSVWVYTKSVENKPWLGQGIKFGIAMWLVLAVPTFLIAYAVRPVPMALMIKQILFEGVQMFLVGIVTAALYRP